MRQVSISTLLLTLCLTVNAPLWAQGTWTPLTNANPSGASGLMMLLSDGTVMVSAGTGITGDSAVWTRLSPDANGNYVNGTWSNIASMHTSRLYFGSNVLPSGEVFVMGGEYSGDGGFSQTGEIYNPLTDKWTFVATFPQDAFGDDPTMVLENGKILCGYIGDGSIGGPTDGFTYLYDPATNTWAQTGTKLHQDQCDEEGFTLLPDGSVLSYNVFASPATGPGSAQRYIPSTGKWVATGAVPVPLTNLTTLGAELGPALLLPDGRVFQIGANNNTVLYNPLTNSWAQGPSLPTNMGCDDAPGAMLPNGKVLFIADSSQPAIFTPPAKVYVFDPLANSITDITPTGALGNVLKQNGAFQCVFLVTPNGHVLLSTNQATIWDFTPSGSPEPAWEPVINTITKVNNTTYTISGTQLNGISEGTSYGDDMENSTNYPIVRLTSAKGAVTYGRTTGWTPCVATGNLQTKATFTIPPSLGIGTYNVSVIANGIPSASKPVFIGGVPSNVTAKLASGVLTIQGDASDNSLTVTMSAGLIKIEGANGTTINSTPSYQAVISGKVVMAVDLGAGDDSIAFVGVNSSTSNVLLGDGNDKAAFTLSAIGTLTIDGGAGTNALLTTSSKFTTLHESNFP